MGQDDGSITPSVQTDTVASAIEVVLYGIGENEDREGLKETPNRVAKFYSQWITHGSPTFSLTTFDAEGANQMIVQRDIPFYSLCEHHLLPFFGVATVAYIPNDKIIGLSKLARIVDWYARRPQNQERLTQQIVSCLAEAVNPIGAAASLTGRHLCMEMRGIRAYGTRTTTTHLLGSIKDDAPARAEFLRNI
jgi:GTP cyclohydrolase I